MDQLVTYFMSVGMNQDQALQLARQLYQTMGQQSPAYANLAAMMGQPAAPAQPAVGGMYPPAVFGSQFAGRQYTPEERAARAYGDPVVDRRKSDEWRQLHDRKNADVFPKTAKQEGK